MTADRVPRVLVTDAERGSAVSIIRSLGRRGWYVVAGSARRGSPGHRSRYAARRVAYANPRTDPERMVEQLRTVIAREAIDLVIPVTEDVALPLTQARDELGPQVRMALPPAEAFEIARDKARTLELAGQLGVPVPRTHLLYGGEPAPHIAEWAPPIVVKPAASRTLANGVVSSLEVAYARDPAQLQQLVDALPAGLPILLQEYCPGIGVGVELLADRGRLVEVFQHRRLREVPVSGGASSYRESVRPDPELVGHAESLMRALSWTGVAMVEFKTGPSGTKLMEINPRVWGSLPLAVAAGVDFPYRMAALHLGLPQEAGPTPYEPGVRARNLTLDLQWAATVLLGRTRLPRADRPSRAQGLRVIADALLHPSRSDMFAADDVGPQLAELAALLGRAAEKLGRSRA